MSVQGPSNYNDFAGLAALKAQSGKSDPEVLREVARQFESLFTSMMLKSMRDASMEDPLFGSDSQRAYRDMFDQQMAVEMSRGKGLGIADMLVRQLSGSLQIESGTGSQAIPLSRAERPEALPRDTAPFEPENPEAFVRGIWPHARSAARELGVDPRSIVAQAALETGWGQHMIRDREGRAGNNLFGIKAGASWTGRRASVDTLEFEHGVARRQRDSFRVYESLADGFRDYVDFLKGSPRYAQALAAGQDTAGFAEGLQQSGYATDPAYADKIRRILGGDLLESALAPLKDSALQPIQRDATGGSSTERVAATRVEA
ncbi:MAG: flagellar assembly peptidoglycan hydrolase FlgJ [Gammaproteobacteria bacterium]